MLTNRPQTEKKIEIVRPVIYTCHQNTVEFALSKGHLNIDSRTNKGNPVWAIPYNLVREYKFKGLSDQELMLNYQTYLEESLINNVNDWKQLKTMKSMVISCDQLQSSQKATRYILRGAIMNYLISEQLNPIHGGEFFRDDHFDPRFLRQHLA